MRGPKHYEPAEEYPADTYHVRQYPGIAFRVCGWETEPDEDTEWSGVEERTGRLIMIMVGDDYKHSIDPDDVAELAKDDYCHVCGQMGCGHDGQDRTEED